MKKVSVKRKNRIKGVKPILIVSAIFASLTLYLLKEYSVVSMFKPSNFYSQDAIVNPFGKITNGFFEILLQITVQIALSIFNFAVMILFVYGISYVVSKILALIAIGVKVLSEVKFSTFDEVLMNVAQPTTDCASLVTCKNLN